MKTKLLIFIICISTSTLLAQNKPEDVLDKFFRTYETEGSDKALDYIFSTNKWMSNSKQQIDDLKSKLKRTVELIGDYNGYELMVKRSIKNHLELYSFIVKYDRQPLRFSILLYKPKDNWRLQNFKYDDNLDAELEEAATAYRLRENLPDY